MCIQRCMQQINNLGIFFLYVQFPFFLLGENRFHLGYAFLLERYKSYYFFFLIFKYSMKRA
jgi:hypothetical protein